MFYYLAMKAMSALVAAFTARPSCRKSTLHNYSHVKRRLSVSCNVRDDALEYLRLVRGSAQLRVEVLKLNLLAAEVVAEAAKLAALVFVPIFVVKRVLFDALPH